MMENEIGLTEAVSGIKFTLPKIKCPKHGIHENFIQSRIPGYEGVWCQICWLETLGSPLELIEESD